VINEMRIEDTMGNNMAVPVWLLKWATVAVGVPHLGTRIRNYLLRECLNQSKPPKNKSALDAGCGYGFTSQVLFRKGYAVNAVDNNPQRLNAASDIAKSLNCQINFIYGSMYHLPFPDDNFDLVVCFEVLEHLKNDLKALREINRVVTQNGLVIISFPGVEKEGKWLIKYHHIKSGYNLNQINQLAAKSGFNIKKILTYNNTKLGLALYHFYSLTQNFPLLASILSILFYPLLLIDSKLPVQVESPNHFVVFSKNS
jgi:ubiquinone/menaquinone biosynthesis C-methylase UbiE